MHDCKQPCLTDNIMLCTITEGADIEHAKLSCALPNQHKATRRG